MRGHIHSGQEGRRRKAQDVLVRVVELGAGDDGKRGQNWHGSYKTRREAEHASVTILGGLDQRIGMTPLATAVDLFSGCGGGSLGLQAAGFQIVGAIELDAVAASSYERLVGASPTIADIRDVTPDALPRLAASGELTLLLGCPPCQSFTDLRRGRNRTAADEVRDRLPEEYLRFVSALEPRHIAFENVPGLASGPNRGSFDTFVASLERLGYRVTWRVLDAADFGVPQHRRRLVLIGSRVATPLLPEPTHGPRATSRIDFINVRHAIGALDPLRSGETSQEDPMHRARRHSDLVLQRLRHLGPSGSHRDLPRDLQLRCHLGHDGHKDAYGRMSWDRPAPTLTSGCTNVSRGRFGHPQQDRAITPREALLLQSFPPTVVLHGGAESIARQIGNALPPALAERIACAVLAVDIQ